MGPPKELPATSEKTSRDLPSSIRNQRLTPAQRIRRRAQVLRACPEHADNINYQFDYLDKEIKARKHDLAAYTFLKSNGQALLEGIDDFIHCKKMLEKAIQLEDSYIQKFQFAMLTSTNQSPRSTDSGASLTRSSHDEVVLEAVTERSSVDTLTVVTAGALCVLGLAMYKE